jgi:hypothetical protein
VVDVVGVVVADLDRLVRELEEARMARIRGFDLAVEARAQEASQVADALGAISGRRIVSPAFSRARQKSRQALPSRIR